MWKNTNCFKWNARNSQDNCYSLVSIYCFIQEIMHDDGFRCFLFLFYFLYFHFHFKLLVVVVVVFVFCFLCVEYYFILSCQFAHYTNFIKIISGQFNIFQQDSFIHHMGSIVLLPFLRDLRFIFIISETHWSVENQPWQECFYYFLINYRHPGWLKEIT